MKFRPWPIVILAAAHFFAPLVNIAYSAWVMKLKVSYYLSMTFGHGHFWQSAPHFIGFPIAGIAIYKCNRWSYPVFLAVTLWMMASNFETWREFPQYFGMASLAFSYLVSLGVVTYFLIPEVREVYFNPRLRWWEQKPRYDVSFTGTLRALDSEREGTIQNLSEGGAFIQTPMILLSGCNVEMVFNAFGKEYRLPGKVAHARRAKPTGYGIQFELDSKTLSTLKKLVRAVKESGAQERIGSVDLKKEFLSWFTNTLKTGKGWVPSTSAAPEPSSSSSQDSSPKSEEQRRSA